jgi:capsular polysaccharide transport system ATP-binding protein
MSVSWPHALAGGLQGTLTGFDNLKFLFRIYNILIKVLENLSKSLQNWESIYMSQLQFYSSGMRAKLALGMRLIIDFDCYLIDEALSVGDRSLENKYQGIMERQKLKSMSLVSHNENILKNL